MSSFCLTLFSCFCCCVVVWLFGWLVGWLVGWFGLVGWLVGLVGWLVWLVGLAGYCVAIFFSVAVDALGCFRWLLWFYVCAVAVV
jgi:hypothetical protein